MRIAHVSDCYAPRLGGIEVQVGELARRQVEAGDEVRVLTATRLGADHDGADGVVVHRITARVPFDLPVAPRTHHHVTDVLRRHRVDVVHVHAGVVSPFAWSGLKAALDLGMPTLVTAHCVWGPLATPGFRLAEKVVRWSSAGAQLSAVSDVAAAPIRSVAADGASVLVLPNGIDPSRWQVEHRPREPGVLRVAAVMRLAPRKRAVPLAVILRNAADALAPQVRLRATVVGDGPDRARLQRHAGGAVRLPGRLSHDAIRSLYATTDVFVQPSVRESFGLAALEARAAGLPVVARSQAGIGTFVRDGVEGLLAADDAGLTAALVRLGQDPVLLDRISDHNRQTPVVQDWPHVLAATRAAYAAAGATAA
ncbi:MAG: glycosyltransferase family 1 protein [Actinomycetota bacterium]|nr:MAG: glycosyltransferase family 1 protein [Actinomycetota bacterium]